MPACHAGDRRFESGRVRHHSAFPYAPSARPDGAFFCPGERAGARAERPIRGDLCHTPAGERASVPGRARPAARRPGDRARRRAARARRRVIECELGAVDRSEPQRRGISATGSAIVECEPDRDRGRVAVVEPHAGHARPIADVPIVPVTNFRAAPDLDRPRRSSQTSWPAPAPATRRSSSSPREADAILAALRRRTTIGRDAASCSRTTRPPSPPTWPRRASGSPSCAPTRSGPRSGRCPGATRRSSASGASRPWRTGR